MSRQRWLATCGGVLALAAIVFLSIRGPEPARAAEAQEERPFPAKSAAKVTMKSQVQHFEYLDDPRVQRVGGRSFVVGRRVSTTGNPAWVYLPVDEVSYIEQYANVDELIKAHPNLAPAKKN